MTQGIFSLIYNVTPPPFPPFERGHKGTVPTLLDIILVTNSKRYSGVLNANFCLSDVHNIVGAATKRSQKPKKINYRSFKHFNDTDFLYDMSCAPFHVADIFDDVDDMAWYTSTLISDIVDHHAPIKSKLIKSKPVPYMNSRLRKALYIRNMAQNKFKKFGKKYWEENRRQRNRVVSIRKQSMKNYLRKSVRNLTEISGLQFRLFFRTRNSKATTQSHLKKTMKLLPTRTRSPKSLINILSV